MLSFFWRPLLVFALLGPLSGIAETLAGRVVGVTDGDTISVLDEKNSQHSIRLAGIDAPERRQAFGERSRQNLRRFAFQNDVKLECHKTDRYRRKVCRVTIEGLDIALVQIQAGMAWHYKQYQAEQSSEDRARYAEMEYDAKAQRIGLWQDKNPISPWEFELSRPRESQSSLAGGLVWGAERAV